MHVSGMCFDGDLSSSHSWWQPWTFLIGGCMELVCQAEQHHILLAISVQLGRHSRTLGVVRSPLFCLSGWAWELVLGMLWGFGPSSTLCVGPSVSSWADKVGH